MLGEVFNTTVNNVTRAWYMNRLGRILVVVILAMIAIVVFVQVSSMPKPLTEYRNYGFILGVWYVALFALFVWLIALLGSPRLKVEFHGGSRPGRTDIGDYQYHVDGAISIFVVTITNMGGMNLNLEPKVILRDKKTGELLWKSPLMPRLPIPEALMEKNKVGEFFGKSPQYCPPLLALKTNSPTQVWRMCFLVEKSIVDRIGVDEHDTIKVFNADYSLEFLDKGLGFTFECVDKGNKFECKRSRLH